MHQSDAARAARAVRGVPRLPDAAAESDSEYLMETGAATRPAACSAMSLAVA